MKLTSPKYADGYKKVSQMKFYGYDRLGVEGGIRDMQNMTADLWPELAVRPERYVTGALYSFGGMFSHNNVLGWVNGAKLVYGGTEYELGEEISGECFVSYGDFVLIWPQKICFDTVSGEISELEARSVMPGGEFEALMFGAVEGELSDRANAIIPGALADSLTDGRFKVGDAVTISGCTRHPANNRTEIIREIVGSALLFLDDAWELDAQMVYTVPAEGLAAGSYTPEDSVGGVHRTITVEAGLTEGERIVIDLTDVSARAVLSDGSETDLTMEAGAYGTLLSFETETDIPYEEPGEVTVARVVPDMEYVFEHDNRLMGCAGDTIYVSAAGDMTNWNVFDGTAADSWATATGSQGNFTGGCSYLGYPRFFKENCIYTLYGDYPSEYSLQRYDAHGVMEGSAKSLCVVNGRLYYLSRHGPMVYTGSLPVGIGNAFGTERYRAGVGGTDGMKYYLSMEREDGTNHLFVYDTSKGLWMREDNLRVIWFAAAVDLYYMDWSGGMGILGRAMEPPEEAEQETEIPWFVEFGEIADDSPDRKLVSKIQLRLMLGEGAEAEVMMLFDSADDWMSVGKISAGKKRSVVLPIIPRRLDHFRLRIEGVGFCCVSSITRQYAAASER